MRLFSTENVSVDTLNCLMDFYRQLNPAKTAKEAIETFFQQLINVSEASTVGLFLKNKQGKLDVSIHGIVDPPEEIPLTGSRVLGEYAKKTDWCLEQYGKEHGQGESERLFLAKFHCFMICPLITGGHNIGVLKFDFCKEPNTSEADRNLLELLSERFASHLNQIQQEAALKQQRIDAWFDHIILKIKECWERKKVREVLTSGCSELRTIDASLIKSFRLYMVDPKGEWHYLDISGGSDRANHEVHYKTSSHITHFVNSGKDLFLYTQQDCASLKLQSFQDHGLKESLCLRTDFRPGLLGQTGMAQESVIVVLWTNEEHFLAHHKAEFLRVVQQIEATLFALPANRPRGMVVGRFQHKTREILDQLLRVSNTNKLMGLLTEKARELAPDADAVSYGEIQWRKGEPCIVIRITDGENRSYDGQNLLIRNQGLWQKAWDSSETVVVNNQYDFGVTKITNPAIANAQSALSVPIFGRTGGGMVGMLDLCSSRLNAFPNNVVDEVEWLVQAFTSRLANLGEAGSANKINPETQAIDCIRQITDLFASFTIELADYQAIFEESIDIVAKSLKASSWILFRRDSENSYAIIRAENCAPNFERQLDKLRYSPVRDLLEEEEELLNSDIRNTPKYKNFLPLLRQDQNACLAARLEMRSISEKSPSDEAVKSTRYGVFLFHTLTGHFQADQRDFFRIALTLIQELMKRKTLATELQRLMPLSVSGAMAAQVAHEIRNPCQPLLLLVRNLQNLFANPAELISKLNSDASYRQDLGKMVEVADSALERINRNASLLMHFSDISSFPTTAVTVEEVLQEVKQYEWYAEEWKPSSTANRRDRTPIVIRIAGGNPSPPPIVHFDRSKLVMILTNLIKNAFEAINASPPRPEGDEIIIGWEWTSEKDSGDLPWWRRGLRSSAKGRGMAGRQNQGHIDSALYPLTIYVSDNGPGMPLQVSEKLFEPFFSTKARGTGLGCTISQMLMQKIDGELRVISVVGSGTTFRLYFPKDHVILKEAKP